MVKPRFLIIGSLTLLAITFVAYAGALRNEFVEFDDPIYVTENPYTAGGLSFAGLRYAWTTLDFGNWIPLTWMSYQLDATLFGIHPVPFHATNLILHGINVVLLFRWLVRVTGSRWRSLVVAAFFSVHPLHVESVAWVSERKDLLSTFWLLTTLLAYERYAVRPSRGWYAATCAALGLGLLSKSMLVTLPILLLLIDLWPLKRWAGAASDQSEMIAGRYPPRSLRQLVLEKMPLLALALADGIVTIIAQGRGETGAYTSLGRLPFHLRLGSTLQGYGWYVAKTIWPTGLSALYPHPLKSLNWGWVGMAAALLTAISLYVGWNGSRRMHLVFGWLWFLIALLPVIGLLQVGAQAYADRYSYIPHIGLLLCIVWESHHWLSRIPSGRSIALAASVVTVALCAGLTVFQVAVWRTTESLWSQALKIDPDNWFAHLQVGNRLIGTGDPDEAYEHFQIVLRQHPRITDALNNLGWIYQGREQWEVAEQYYRRAIEADPQYAKAIHNLITVLKKQDRIAEIATPLKTYADRHPDDVRIHNELGLIYARKGLMESARTHFAQAVSVAPDNLSARNNLALALAQLNRYEEAKSHLETVLSLQPNDGNAHVNLGMLLEKTNQLESARDHYSAALRLNPDDKEARQRLQMVDQRLSAP